MNAVTKELAVTDYELMQQHYTYEMLAMIVPGE